MRRNRERKRKRDGDRVKKTHRQIEKGKERNQIHISVIQVPIIIRAGTWIQKLTNDRKKMLEAVFGRGWANVCTAPPRLEDGEFGPIYALDVDKKAALLCKNLGEISHISQILSFNPNVGEKEIKIKFLKHIYLEAHTDSKGFIS